MSVYPKELVESYCLEVISRSIVIQEKCASLLSKDFASNSPKVLATTIRKMSNYLVAAIEAIYKNIDWEIMGYEEIENYIDQLRNTDTLIRRINSHLRYIDGAQTRNLPWSIITALQSFLVKMLPNTNVRIMLRPKWNYNFSIITSDLTKLYYDELEEYSDILPDKSLDEVFSDFKNPFHIVSFPSLERKNILLYCLLGHEIGHLIARKYVDESEFLKNIKDDITKITLGKLSLKEKELPLFKEVLITEEMKVATTAWKRALEELLSDIVGALLFGPATLFSTFEFSMQFTMDQLPSDINNYYPPWRLRLRKIQEILEHTNNFFPLSNKWKFSDNLLKKVNSRYEVIKAFTSSQSDSDAINKNSVLEIVYREVEKSFINKKEKIYEELISLDMVITPDLLYAKLPHFVERLDFEIPPNAYEPSINDREPAKLVEIINASWFHKISWEDAIFTGEGTFNKDMVNKRDKMNRLTLKAIEFAELEEKYRYEYGKPSPYEIN